MNLATTKINQDTPAKKVREELARITGRSEWVKQDYWAYFLKNRTGIMDSIFQNHIREHFNFTHPATVISIKSDFVKEAQVIFGENPKDSWILEGKWFDSPDIMTWIYFTYWKGNKHKWIEGAQSLGFLKPWNIAATSDTRDGERTLGATSESISTGDARDPEPATEASVSVDSKQVKKKIVREWMDVMLQQ